MRLDIIISLSYRSMSTAISAIANCEAKALPVNAMGKKRIATCSSPHRCNGQQ